MVWFVHQKKFSLISFITKRSSFGTLESESVLPFLLEKWLKRPLIQFQVQPFFTRLRNQSDQANKASISALWTRKHPKPYSDQIRVTVTNKIDTVNIRQRKTHAEKLSSPLNCSEFLFCFMVPQTTLCCQKTAKEYLLLRLEKEDRCYPGGVQGWNDDSLPVASSHTTTQPLSEGGEICVFCSIIAIYLLLLLGHVII